MKYIGDVISSDVDMSPVITPVVDLSQLQKGAGKINTLMGHIPLSADVSLAQARAISADKSADRNLDALSSGSEPSVIKLEQNNYSPEALSTAEIYRRTKNLVAMAETAAGAPTASKLP